MACGCGGAQAGDKFEVIPNDGTGVTRFPTKAEADVHAARSGGVVKPLATAK